MNLMSLPFNVLLGVGVAAAAALAPQFARPHVDPVTGLAPWAAARDDVVVPAARFPQDPADSLYRVAREAFNRGDFERAQQLFQVMRERWPQSAYRASALYFGAYALYRLDGSANLRRSRELLAEHSAMAVGDAARGDAEALRARVEGRLAQLGDLRAAENVVRSAELAAGAAAASGGGRGAAGASGRSSPSRSTIPT